VSAEAVRAGHRQRDRVVVGIGARGGVELGDLRVAIDESLVTADLVAEDLVAIVSVDAKRAALQPLAGLLGVPLHTHASDLLAQQPVPNPSGTAERLIGTPSVAEAAVLAFGAELLLPKQVFAGITVAIGRLPAEIEPEDDGFDLSHHGDAETAPGLVDLAVNVRADAPVWLRSQLRDAVDRLTAYPNPGRATAAVAQRHGRPAEQVLLTAGAAEAFVLIARALAPERAVVIHPQFTEPEAALHAAGRPVRRILLAAPFTLDPELVPEDADLVVVGNPTNPTSVLHPASTLLALARPGRVLVVDEAFMDAVPGEPESLAGHPSRPGPSVPGLLVVRSLTKTWGLAGLRIGYLLGDPDLLRACRTAQPLWSVGSIALEAAIACSSPAAVAEAEQRALAAVGERDHLLELLAGLPQVEVAARPRAPFVLLRALGPDPAGVHQRLRDDGWAVRRADTFPGLGPGWLRAAVRDRATSEAFVVALARAVLTSGRPAGPPPGFDAAGITGKSS
jgi:histidinol-phosphate aminotransferase